MSNRGLDAVQPVRELPDDLDVGSALGVANQIDRLNLLSDEMPRLPFPLS